MMPAFDLERLLDSLADKVAERLRQDSCATSQSIRPRLLTVEQAATYIGRSKEAVQHMVASGKVPVVRSDRRVFVDVEDLNAWIREHKQAGV